MFLGAPAVLSSQQRPCFDEWLSWFHEQSVEALLLQRSHYGVNPWDTLMRTMSRAHGVALLGFEQLDARGSIWRRETAEEERISLGWTTPWLQLEAGLAIASGLPVLVARDVEVREGIFDPDAWVGQVTGTQLSLPGGERTAWLGSVRRLSMDDQRPGSRYR